ncbi:hypothetical protein [Nocardioides sp.]|uniref:hypothetical protein n=1 Tax=Nocardioides sp. TaxID=35761 RepID=UPI002CA389FC|nr:hypothetical protein [Nocardioides sp.]HXH79513.1 hypothetical protein [Nocardioides sp.]
MELISYDGFAFADLNMYGGLDADSYRGNWQVNARYVARVGAPGHLGPGEVAPTTIEATIGWDGVPVGAADDLLLTFDRMVGRLDPLNQSPKRKLVVERPDGVRVWRYANVVLPGGVDPDGAIDRLVVRFTSADPLWRKETETTILPSSPLQQVTGTNSAVSLPNAGQAAIHPVYRMDWNGTQRGIGTGTATLGWRFRWTLTVTNNRPNTVDRWPYWVDLGNTAALVSAGKALATGNDLRVLFQGRELARQLVAWNEAQSYALVLLPRLEAGQVVELDVVYGNSVAGAPKTLQYPDQPAIQTDTHVANALSGSTVGQLNATEALALTNAVALGGTLVGLTGPNAGVSRTIQGFTTAAGVTNVFTDTFSTAWAAGNRFLVLSSRNGRLLWNTSVTERGNNPSRGRWYLSSGESPPDLVDYRVPVAWRPALYADGRDKKGQRRFSRLSTGGDLDSFAILDASRTWENGPSVPEEGAADGVALSLPFPITAYRTQMKRTNPSGMCRAIVASRGQGGEQYRELAGIDTHVATETTWDPGTLVTPTDTLHLYTGLIPAEGDEIPPDWRSDQGTTTTSGATTSLTDGEKAWRDGQWVGATLRITSGKLKGTTRTITGNTATVLSYAATSSAIGGDNTYELRHKPLLATLRDFVECNVDVDLSGLVATGTVANENPVYHHRGRMWLGGGYGISPVRRGEVRIGTPDDWVLTRSSEGIRLDSAKRTATIYHVPTGAVIRYLTEPTVQWLSIVTEGGVTTARRSQDGMPLPIGVNPLANPGAAVNTTGVTVVSDGGVVAAVSRITSAPTPFQQPGAFRLQLTTNPGGANAIAQLVWPLVPARAGDLIEVTAAVQTTSTSIRPRIGLYWLDNVGIIQTSFQATYAPVANTWLSIGEMFTAPAGAVAYQVIVRADPNGTATLGSIYVDAVDPGSPVLWYDEIASAGIRIGASYTEGFLG